MKLCQKHAGIFLALPLCLLRSPSLGSDQRKWAKVEGVGAHTNVVSFYIFTKNADLQSVTLENATHAEGENIDIL